MVPTKWLGWLTSKSHRRQSRARKKWILARMLKAASVWNTSTKSTRSWSRNRQTWLCKILEAGIYYTSQTNEWCSKSQQGSECFPVDNTDSIRRQRWSAQWKPVPTSKHGTKASQWCVSSGIAPLSSLLFYKHNLHIRFCAAPIAIAKRPSANQVQGPVSSMRSIWRIPLLHHQKRKRICLVLLVLEVAKKDDCQNDCRIDQEANK